MILKAKEHGQKLLTIESTILDIAREHINNNRSMTSIAKEMRVSIKALTNVLKQIGFEYDATLRKWRFILIEGKDYRDCTFYSIQNGTAKPAQLTEDKTFTTIDTDDNVLTIDEIQFLKQFVASQQQQQTGDDSGILQAINCLPADIKTSKKTFVLNDDVINDLDNYCDVMRIKKSDFLSVAIKDALNKYK